MDFTNDLNPLVFLTDRLSIKKKNFQVDNYRRKRQFVGESVNKFLCLMAPNDYRRMCRR